LTTSASQNSAKSQVHVQSARRAMVRTTLVLALLLVATQSFVPKKHCWVSRPRLAQNDEAIDPEVIVGSVEGLEDDPRRARLKGYYREELRAGDDAITDKKKKLGIKNIAAKVGESGAVAWVGINVAWYAIGVNIFLYGLPLPAKGAIAGPRLVLKRFAAAWGMCWIASQWSAGLRAALAVTLSPITSRLLAAIRRRLPKSSPRWLAPTLSLGFVVTVFLANAAACLLREIVRITAAAAAR